jgi:hypothetical protein
LHRHLPTARESIVHRMLSERTHALQMWLVMQSNLRKFFLRNKRWLYWERAECPLFALSGKCRIRNVGLH